MTVLREAAPYEHTPYILLAVDPSIICAGVALFVEGKLAHADYLKLKRCAQGRAGRAAVMGHAIASWCKTKQMLPGAVVCEWPQVYKHFKADPNDMLPMAAVAGAIAVLNFAADIRTILPNEWKGSVKKSAMRPRIAACLAPNEVSLVPDEHDAWDAVGIGLWFLNRLERKRVLPGAT